LESTAAPLTGGLFADAQQRHSRDLSEPLLNNKDVIDSSRQGDEDEADPQWDRIKKRSFFGGIFAQTSFVSITNCTTTVTTTTRTLTLGTSGAVTCLPSGLVTC